MAKSEKWPIVAISGEISCENGVRFTEIGEATDQRENQKGEG